MSEMARTDRELREAEEEQEGTEGCFVSPSLWSSVRGSRASFCSPAW